VIARGAVGGAAGRVAQLDGPLEVGGGGEANEDGCWRRVLLREGAVRSHDGSERRNSTYEAVRRPYFPPLPRFEDRDGNAFFCSIGFACGLTGCL
jgi:hypothetical protein